MHVEEIVRKHWSVYGRNYYSRYDYEGVASVAANEVIGHLRNSFATLPGTVFGKYVVATADEFTYLDPIDHSVSRNQGIRVLFSDGSRVVYRLSGTAGSGATIRVYIERYESDPAHLGLVTAEALKELSVIALSVSKIPEITGMKVPTVIT